VKIFLNVLGGYFFWNTLYRPKYYTVTLKSRVTQGHWKRNHWIDHTRLTIRRVIWRRILSWPSNMGYRSLKVIESGTIWKLGYGFLFAFNSNYGRIFSHFGYIQRQRTAWPWNLGLWSFKVIGSIDHVWLYWSAIVTIALSCSICELFDVE